MKSQLAIIVLALGAAAGAQAQDRALHGLLGMGITGGGETLATVQYTNGTSQNVKSGGLVEFFGGFDYHEAGSPFSVRGSIGYHTDDSNASNGSVRFSRWPAELLVFWNANDKFRLGAGARKALSPKLTSSGDASNLGDYTLGSTTGAVVEGEYRVMPSLGVSLRYVAEKYTVPGAKIDGNHVGVRGTWYF